MGDKNELHSALRRARIGVVSWFDALPEDARMDACSALDHLIRVAEREIEQAYFDGNNHRADVERRRPFLPNRQESK